MPPMYRRLHLEEVEQKPDKPKRSQSERLRELWPDLREMILPRRGILGLGFMLMVINRLCGLVLPLSTKFLIDDVINRGRRQLLAPLVLAVLAATLIQGDVIRTYPIALEGRAAP